MSWARSHFQSFNGVEQQQAQFAVEDHLRLARDTQRIEAHFGWKFRLLTSWFRSLSDLRNLCAHHARVWNREFGSRPEMPRKVPADWPSVPDAIATGAHQDPGQTLAPRRRLYLQLVVIESLMRVVCPESGWAERLLHLLARYPHISRPHMGFPPGWENETFWRAVAPSKKRKTP